MAWIRSRSEYQAATGATSYTPTLPLGLQNGDLMVAVISQYGIPAITCKTSGTTWNSAATQTSAFTIHAIFTKVAGASEPAPVISNAGPSANPCTITIFAIAGFTGTESTCIDGASIAYSSSGSHDIASRSLTTSTDNCLLIHTFALAQGNDLPVYINPQDATTDSVLVAGGLGGNAIHHVVAHTYQGTSGAIPTFNARTHSTSAYAVGVIAIKDNGNVSNAPVTESTITVLRNYAGTASDPPTFSTPNTVLGSATINSVGMSSYSCSTENNKPNSSWLRYGVRVIAGGATNGAMQGMFDAITCNLTGKTVGIMWGSLFSPITKTGSNGVCLTFVDNAGNWAAFQVQTQANWISAVTFQSFVNVTSTPFAYSGTMDWANVAYIGMLLHASNGNSAYTIDCILSNLIVINDWKLVRGSTGRPLSTNDIRDIYAGGEAYPKMIGNQGSRQALLNAGVQIGDGTIKTVTVLAGDSIAFQTTQADGSWQVPAQTQTFNVKTSSSDTFNADASIFVTDTRQTWAIDSGASTSATFSFIGASFIGWDVNWLTGVTCNGATFSGCYDLDFKGGSLTRVTIKNPLSTVGAMVTANGSTFAQTTIDVTGSSAAYHLSLGTSVTAITLTDVTFTGSAATNRVHVLKTSGTVTITITGTTSLTSGQVTSDGATVVIASSPVYQQVVINGLVVGSRVQIYDTTHSTQLANATATGGDIVFSNGGTTATWTDPATASSNRAIRLRAAFGAYSTVGTMTIASPAVVTATTIASIAEADPIQFTTTGALPTGLTAGTTYYVKSLSGSTFNVAATAGGTAINTTGSQSGTHTIHHVKAYEFIDANIGTCGTTSTTNAVTYQATQTADTTYNTNGIDGGSVTDITIETSGGNRVKINKAGGAVTWPQIYAYQVYWQFTSTGIAQETAFIEAPDTANYLLTDFDIKNTHATVPLTITGGWGRDSVTLTVAGCIDTTGTSIFPEPDHVVAYSTGSGLTAGQAAELTAAASSASAAAASTSSLTYSGTAVQADIRKVKGTTVTGAGTSDNPWGP